MANGRHRRTGTIIKEELEAWWIHAYGGCPCAQLAAEMDQKQPEDILSNIEHWTDRMVESVKEWRSTGLRRLVPQPPRHKLRDFIEWAANKSIEESQAA